MTGRGGQVTAQDDLSNSAGGVFPLPITVEEITAEWLTAALASWTPGVTVRSAEIVDTIFTTCSKVRLRLDLNDAGRKAGIPELVVLKGGFEAQGREFSQMHLREVRGYRDVYPFNPLPSPACYFAEYDPDRRQGIIIMEDLVEKGVTFCHATRPQSHEQIARRLTALARFHAASWESADIHPGGRWHDLVGFFPVMQPFFDKKASPENWARFVALPRGAAVATPFQDRDWMLDAWAKQLRFADSLPQCVLHGDIHLGNLYEEKDGTPGFLDTLASKGPGMLEVSYHITASIDASQRRQSEGALVQHYLDELARNGVTPPSFAEAMHQYVVFMTYGYFIWMTTESHYQPESVNTANNARMSMAMIDHDMLGVMAALPSA
jgi:hypothetical protein